MRGPPFPQQTDNRSRSRLTVMKIGVNDGLDDLNLASLVASYSSDLLSATDLDLFNLIGRKFRQVKNYDILHISGYEACGVLQRPLLRDRVIPFTFSEFGLDTIKEVLKTTGIEPKLVILDTPPLVESDEEYIEVLEKHHIRAIMHYLTRQPSLHERKFFLPRFLEAVLIGRSFEAAIRTGTIMEKGKKFDLQPKMVFNEKLLGISIQRLKHVSLVYPV